MKDIIKNYVENDEENKVYYSKACLRRIRSLIVLICFTVVLLISSIYAWLSAQKSVSLNELQGRIEVAEGLKISLDAEIWSQSISFGTPYWDGDAGYQQSLGITSSWDEFDLGIQKDANPYQAQGVNYVTNNIRPLMNQVSIERGTSGASRTTGYLTPVSSSGKLTSDYERLAFYEGKYQGTSLKNISQTLENIETGMYAFDVYLMNTSKSDNADQLYLNYDSIVREIKKSSANEDFGLKNAVRVGFAFYSGVTGTSSSKDEVLKNTYGTMISQVAIWEPNYDTHSEYVMTQNEQLKTLANNKTSDAAAINSLCIDDIPVNDEIEDVYTDDESTIGLKRYTSIKTKGEVVTATLNDKEISANASGIQKIVDTDGENVKLIANKISKLRIYVWLEGQDPDCVNWASHSDGIDVNIGLTKASSEMQLSINSTSLAESPVTTSTHSWVQYRDEDTKTPYVTNGNVTLEVGSAVSGYSVTVDGTTWGDGNWFVLGAENGKLLISTNQNVGTQELSGQNGYVNGIEILNSVVSGYKNEEMAENVREINVDDINRVTGYDPKATGDGTGGVYKDSSTLNVPYGENATYSLSDEYLKLNVVNGPSMSYKLNLLPTDGSEVFTYYNGNEWISLNTGESITLKGSYYKYYPNTLTSQNEDTVNGISLESNAYNMLFSDTDGIELTSTTQDISKYYWLGSQFLKPVLMGLECGLLFVSNGGMNTINIGNDCQIYDCFYDHSHDVTLGIRPTVTLKSEIIVDSNGNLSMPEEEEIQGNWTQYRNESEKSSYVTNGEITFEVGSAVKGYSVTVDSRTWGDGEWYILGAENGRLVLTTDENVCEQELSGMDGYNNGIDILNSDVANFKDNTYAESVRSINADDINRVTGYDPTTCYYYEIERYDIKSTKYYYNMCDYLNENNIAYRVLGKSNQSTQTAYWLANAAIYPDLASEVDYYMMCYTTSSNIHCDKLGIDWDYPSEIVVYSDTLGVRPAVILKPNVNIDSDGNLIF